MKLQERTLHVQLNQFTNGMDDTNPIWKLISCPYRDFVSNSNSDSKSDSKTDSVSFRLSCALFM